MKSIERANKAQSLCVFLKSLLKVAGCSIALVSVLGPSVTLGAVRLPGIIATAWSCSGSPLHRRPPQGTVLSEKELPPQRRPAIPL